MTNPGTLLKFRYEKFVMKNMKPENPFILTGYYSPEFFCNRQEETLRLTQAIKNNRNITLFSIRRIGKTALINHLFYKLRNEKNRLCFYIDVLPTTNLSAFVNLFASTVLGKIESKPEKFVKKVGQLFSSIKPVITFDPITGLPLIQFNIQSVEEADKSLEKIFKYLNESNKKIVLAIDEFQQITNYPEKNIEAVLRSHIQQSRNINFIFSGSQKHILLSIFSKYGNPFYQSTEMMQLERISETEYAEFIKKNFERGKKKINKDSIIKILELCRRHTYYVQFLCNRLYSTEESNISENLVLITLESILKENEPVYLSYRNLLTSYQWKVLTAIALEGSARLITSKDFIAKHNLGTPSSVQSAVKSLIEKEMIFKEEDYFYVYDVFLERWLERNAS